MLLCSHLIALRASALGHKGEWYALSLSVLNGVLPCLTIITQGTFVQQVYIFVSRSLFVCYLRRERGRSSRAFIGCVDIIQCIVYIKVCFRLLCFVAEECLQHILSTNKFPKMTTNNISTVSVIGNETRNTSSASKGSKKSILQLGSSFLHRIQSNTNFVGPRQFNVIIRLLDDLESVSGTFKVSVSLH